MRRNHWIIGGVVLFAVAAVGAAWFFVGAPLRSSAVVGTGYVAKYVCSCVFVTGRDAAACKADLGPSLDRITMHVDESAGHVTARASIIATAVAFHETGFGCRFD